MIHDDTFKPVTFDGAKGLVFIEDKILVYRRDFKTDSFPGYIDLPGGKSEKGETPFETFRRETKEEFGIHIDAGEIEASYRVPSMKNPGMYSYWMVARTGRFTAHDIVFGDEGSEWMLMTPKEFVQRPDGIERHQKRTLRYLAREVISE